MRILDDLELTEEAEGSGELSVLVAVGISVQLDVGRPSVTVAVSEAVSTGVVREVVWLEGHPGTSTEDERIAEMEGVCVTVTVVSTPVASTIEMTVVGMTCVTVWGSCATVTKCVTGSCDLTIVSVSVSVTVTGSGSFEVVVLLLPPSFPLFPLSPPGGELFPPSLPSPPLPSLSSPGSSGTTE